MKHISSVAIGWRMSFNRWVIVVLCTLMAQGVAQAQSTYQNVGRAGSNRNAIRIQKNIANGVCLISDVSNYQVDGYNAAYFINDVYVGPSLTNYAVPVNAKFVIDKVMTKFTPTTDNSYQRFYTFDGVDILNNPSMVNGFHQEVIDTYDPATPINSRAVVNGTLLPLNDTWFVRSNNWNSQAMKHGPNIMMPPGRYWGGKQLEGKADMATYRAHWFNGFEKPTHQVYGGPNESVPEQEQVAFPNGDVIRGVARQGGYNQETLPWEAGVYVAQNIGSRNIKFQFDQMSENTNTVLSSDPGYLGYQRTLVEMGGGREVFGAYGQAFVRYRVPFADFRPSASDPRRPTSPSFKGRYISEVEARKIVGADGIIREDPFYSIRANGYSYHSAGMNQLIQLYPTSLNTVDYPYIKMHEVDIMLKQDPNRQPLGYFWPMRENVVCGPCNTPFIPWEHETTSPVGRKIRYNQQVHGLTALEAFAFDMTIRGKGCFYFADSEFHIDDPNRIEAPRPDQPDPPFEGNGTFQTQPIGVTHNKPGSPHVGYDAAFQGRNKAVAALEYLAHNTPNWNYRPEWAYASYTINPGQSGSETRNAPTDGTAILEHARDYKPMAMVLTNPSNGRKVVWAFDPYCSPNTSKQLQVEYAPNQYTTFELRGNSVHVVLVNGIPLPCPTLANAVPNQAGTVGQAFNFTIPANTFNNQSGATITISGLPAGVSSSGGTITGTPTTAGTSTITVQAVKAGCSAVSTTFTITVNTTPVTLSFQVRNGTTGSPQSVIQAIDNGTVLNQASLPASVNYYIVANGTVPTAYNRIQTSITKPDGTSFGWNDDVTGGDGGPYGVYGRSGNTGKEAGTYQLTARAFLNGTQMAEKTISFQIGNDPCAAFTQNTIVAHRTGNPAVKMYVQVTGNCKQAYWNNGEGLAHRDWLFNNFSTATNGFTLEQIGQCLKFYYESCNARVATESTEGVDLLNVFPNPTSGPITAEIYSKQAGRARTSLVTLSGQEILSSNQEMIQGLNRLEMTVPTGSAKMLLLKVKLPDGSEASKRILLK